MDTTKPLESAIDDPTLARARQSGRRLLARGPLATAARYEAGRIHVELNNGCAFEFPVEQAQGLAGAKASDLQAIEISAAELGLHLPRLDANLYVPSLIKGVLGTRHWMAVIGAVSGTTTTEAKAAAARIKLKDIWALRVRLQMESRVRELAEGQVPGAARDGIDHLSLEQGCQ